MFQEKEVKAYQNLKAPDILYNRIEVLMQDESVKRKVKQVKQKRILRMVCTIAACMILVIAIGLSNHNTPTGIILNGQKLETSVWFYDISPASDLRSSPIFSVPLELDIQSKTKLSVSYGTMRFLDGEVTVNKTVHQPASLWWELPRDEAQIPVCELYLEDEQGVTKITLTYDDAEKIITATKTK